MKKNKKKLPKFWLGTRMPNSLGYQPNYGIGGYLYTSTPGAENVLTETNTIKSNIIPSTLNKAQTYGSTLASMWKNTIPLTLTESSRLAMGNYLVNSFNEAVYDGAIKSTAPKMNYVGGGLNAAGKALGVVGAAYGLTDMGFLIANNQDHRTAADMRNTLTTNTYTTDLGNKYTTHGGVDIGSELDYARKLKLSKNLNFTTTAIGTGATIGSLFSPIGTAVGAGVGALVGLGANALGFGDTEEETKAAANRLTDVTSMEDKMSYSLAMNKDALQGFYGRTKSGSLPTAACGKQPGKKLKGYNKGTPVDPNKKQWCMSPEGPVWAFPDSVGAPGETAVRTDENGNVISASILPGIPSNDDIIPMKIGNGKGRTLKNGMPPGSQNVAIMTNQHGISDMAQLEIKNSGNINGALALQDILMNNGNTYMMNGRNTDLLFLAKCGKLPKYDKGTPTDPSKYNPTYGGWGDYILTAMPNMAALYSAWDQYQTDKHMPVEAPNRQIDLSGARNALYRMYGDLIDARPYMNAIDLDTSRAIYRAQRNPGAGYGGRMVLENAITSNAIAEKARQGYAIDQANLQQRNTVNQALAALDQQQLAWENDNFWKSTSLRQAAQAAKYKALAQDRLNLVNPLAQMTKGILDMRQFNVSNALKNRMINIYENQANTETLRFLAEKAAAEDAKQANEYNKLALAYLKLSSNPKIALFLPYFNWMGWRPVIS